MKKIISFLLIFSILFVFCSCGRVTYQKISDTNPISVDAIDDNSENTVTENITEDKEEYDESQISDKIIIDYYDFTLGDSFEALLEKTSLKIAGETSLRSKIDEARTKGILRYFPVDVEYRSGEGDDEYVQNITFYLDAREGEPIIEGMKIQSDKWKDDATNALKFLNMPYKEPTRCQFIFFEKFEMNRDTFDDVLKEFPLEISKKSVFRNQTAGVSDSNPVDEYKILKISRKNNFNIEITGITPYINRNIPADAQTCFISEVYVYNPFVAIEFA